MPIYYVGTGGNDGNSGLTWALRKLTLNGVEDTPVVAGDTVYVGPGTYREMLTCDVSGGVGTPITYIGDYGGANTDGVGGVVRITGSDNDQTATRANAIAGNLKDWRTFTGFQFDTCTSSRINLNAAAADSCTNWMLTKCLFLGLDAQVSLLVTDATGVGGSDNAITVQDCAFLGGSFGITFQNTDAVTSTNLIQNCLFLAQVGTAGVGRGISIGRIGGGTIKNCTFIGAGSHAVIVAAALPLGYTPWTVNNCLFYASIVALQATALGELVEDYNDIYACNIPRTNVGVGANSLAYPPLFDARWFFQLVTAGQAQQVVSPFDLASYSQLINVAGTAPPTTDMRNIGIQGAAREWGPLEYLSTLNILGGAGGMLQANKRGNKQ